MTTTNLGDQLNHIVSQARAALFEQGELAQLTYGAFDIAARLMQESGQDEIEVTYPVGLGLDRKPIESKRTYKKEELLGRYQLLAFQLLSVHGLVHLVAIIEALLGDVVRAVVMKYPQKLGGKRTVAIQTVLEATSIEEIHLRATDALLNELSYKSPNEFAESLQPLLSLNLLECPAFHKYMEIKASRDIFIHNRGIANDIYVRKAGSHVRAKAGWALPADTQYFLESYECCLQLNEWLEMELHTRWHSSEFEARTQPAKQLPFPST
ncbi:MAG: hypothetical protein A3J28_00175 [Acidobacteria bacterium RIFCSPLOWO2_12_FULL_60_22]|nr:MAG: hypothetical protein A3J28_00175 [Acidobacteria bacterium RIFCSPLOWO2_12_FULL_60_22]